MTADELARVTAERDAAVAALARVEALADPEVFAQRLYWQGGLSEDLIPLLEFHAARVVAVTIDPPQDAWAANEAAGDNRGVPWWEAAPGKRLRDGERHAAGVGWDLAHAEMCSIGGPHCSWHQPITAGAQAGRLRDALRGEGARSTRDGSASPEDPVAGRVEASESFSSPWIANAVNAAILPIRFDGHVTFSCECSGIEREAIGDREWTRVYLPCEVHARRAVESNGTTGEAMK